MLHFLATVALCMALVLFVQHQRDRRRERKEAKRLEAVGAYHRARMEQLLSTTPSRRSIEPEPSPTPPPPSSPPRYEPTAWLPPSDRWVHPAILATCVLCLVVIAIGSIAH